MLPEGREIRKGRPARPGLEGEELLHARLPRLEDARLRIRDCPGEERTLDRLGLHENAAQLAFLVLTFVLHRLEEPLLVEVAIHRSFEGFPCRA